MNGDDNDRESGPVICAIALFALAGTGALIAFILHMIFK